MNVCDGERRGVGGLEFTREKRERWDGVSISLCVMLRGEMDQKRLDVCAVQCKL